MSKRILYLSDYELRALQAKGKTLTEVQQFQISRNGETEFANYLSRAPKTPIHWLVDTTGEEYHATLVPHVLGLDRRNLVAQRKKRLFEGTPYTYGVIQGRETQEQRKNDRALFTALTNSDFLQPWLNLIIAHKVPLVGIYSLPLKSEHLLKYLPKAPYTLLVAQAPQINSHSLAGLRQSFFINQKLQYSRLISLNTLNPQEYAEYVLEQITLIQRHLERERMLPQTGLPEPLSVVILTDTPLLSGFDTLPNYDTTALNLHILDSREVAHKIGLNGKGKKGKGLGNRRIGLREMGSRKPERALYLYDLVAFQLSRRWYTANHYATTADIRYFLYRKVRQAIYFTSVLLLSGATAASWVTLEKTAKLQQQSQKNASEIAKRQAKLEQLRKQEPKGLPLDIELLSSVVNVGRRLKARHLSPRPAWVKLSHVLNRHPNVFIERLEWGIGHVATEIFQSDLKSPLEKNDNDTEDSENPLGKIDPAKNFIEGMRLHGKIHPFKGYRKALQSFKQFVKDLRKQPKDFCKIKVLLAPSIPTKLQGKIGTTQKTDKAPFIIDILIKHRYAKKPS
ncbi:MAG: hypothetical protein DRR08_00280 [Candidatus Parabeggiatoa sp. nov. 2]|nr:MAG: hypothetical protein DRR08_00280 [Gammaproteobacteria bacterium]